jgi:hypothetical protein
LPIDADGNDCFDEDGNPIEGRVPVSLWVRRFDYIDEETFDEMTADLEAFDVDQQMVGVANDLAGVPAGTSVFWEPLIPATVDRLKGLGVSVKRIAFPLPQADGQPAVSVPREEISAKTTKVLAALEPYSSRKLLSSRKRSRDIALTMLKHVLPEDKLALCSRLTSGDLEQMLEDWRAHSRVGLGESVASASSSTSTEAPSTPTSSSKGIPETDSDET